MDLEVRKKGKVDILGLHGPLTIEAGDVILREQFRKLVDAGHKLFILNLAAVDYMDSGGLGELAACSMRACEREGRIKLVITPGGKVEEILKVTHLDRAFHIFHDEEEALASFIA